ncbi:hypothetical protein [Paenibacillus sp. y28]|uniref:hypothetical protein n=1 Tax=Paenibacillus sp. y28 TaxID=3129110 RepID=UPI003018DDAE
MGPHDKPFISNGTIVLFLFVFFPLVVVLMIARVLKHRSYTHLRILDGRFFAKFLFYIFLVMSVVYFGQLIAGNEPLFSVYLFFIVFALIPSTYFRARAEMLSNELDARFKHYRRMLYEEGVTSIPHLAQSVSRGTETVLHELQRMIHLGLLPGAYLDTAANRIQLSPEAFQSQDEHSYAEDEEETGPVPGEAEVRQSGTVPQQPPKAVECHGCGFKVQLKPGQQQECQFCGSVIPYS